jgi:predicted phosphate transport protein (TIGR00153 family)
MFVRLPFLKMFMSSPFEGLQEHAEKVIECAWAFQQGMECYFAAKCQTFEEFRHEVNQIESQADAIKRRIRGHIPKRTMMPISNFLVFRYLKEQDEVLDRMEDSLDWVSYRAELRIPEELEKDFALLVDAVINPIEELKRLVAEARLYFKTYSEDQRVIVKDIIRKLRQQEHEADNYENIIKKKVFHMESDPVSVFHLVTLAETIGAIADHAQNAGDMMRAMLSK